MFKDVKNIPKKNRLGEPPHIFTVVKVVRVSRVTSVARTETSECIFIEMQLLICKLSKVFFCNQFKKKNANKTLNDCWCPAFALSRVSICLAFFYSEKRDIVFSRMSQS